MSHVADGTSSFRTPKEWLPAASQCSAWANKIARRDDLTCSIGPEAAKEAGTAWFMPSRGDIELSATRLLPGVKPEDFDLGDKLWQLRQGQFMGALAHEAAHAAFSHTVPQDLANWRGDDGERLTRRECDVLNVLEESRIEYLLLRRNPRLKKFMRRMAMEIVNADFKVADTRYGASIGAALTVARVDAGSVSRPAGKRFGKLLRERLDLATLTALRRLWMEYHRLEIASAWDFPYVQCKRIAADWIALVVNEDEAAAEDLASSVVITISFGDEDGEDGDGDSATPTPGSGSGEGEEDGDAEAGAPGDGDGEGKPAVELPEELGDILAKALGEIAREESMDADSDLAEEAKDEMTDRKLAEKHVDANRREEGKREAGKTFAPTGKHAWGGDSHGRRTIERRKPTAAERAAATRLSQDLAKVTTHDKIITRKASMLPPGRVKGRAAVMGSAQLANRQQITAEPFVATRRRHVESDKIAVGVAADVSGSMGASEEPLGVLSYVVANAASKVDAQFCSVLFGSRAEGMVKPGQKVDQVVTASAVDGTEMIAPALKTLDHELDLLDGSGARVLIIMTDAHLVQKDQADYTRTWMRLAKQRGLTVIWCHWGSFKSNYGYGTVLELRGKSPAECATLLGREILRAVKLNQAA
jgi:hypothetical protein